jgi:hypothetical protein
MHGMFTATSTAFDPAFDAFIASLYDKGTLPPIAVVQDVDDDREFFKRTGRIAVLLEDESVACPVFGNWSTYYEFEGWLAYRSMSRAGDEFQLMATDVLSTVAWSPETVAWINVIHGLTVVLEKYAEAFGHYPASLYKFIKSYVRYGEDTVLSGDRY